MELSSMVSLGIFGAACFAAATSGAIFQPGQWYENLRHPSWRPPNGIFGLVWSVLYCMIAAAGWLVWEAAGWAAAGALAIYGLQLVLNFGWSWVFFGLRRPDWALAELALLWASIAATIWAFAPHSATAAWLMAPYLLWVSFAAVLNFTLWRLNPRAHLSSVSGTG